MNVEDLKKNTRAHGVITNKDEIDNAEIIVASNTEQQYNVVGINDIVDSGAVSASTNFKEEVETDALQKLDTVIDYNGDIQDSLLRRKQQIHKYNEEMATKVFEEELGIGESNTDKVNTEEDEDALLEEELLGIKDDITVTTTYETEEDKYTETEDIEEEEYDEPRKQITLTTNIDEDQLKQKVAPSANLDNLSSLDTVDFEEEMKRLETEDNDDNVNEDDENKELIEQLKSALREKIKPVKDNLDLSTFTIIKRPVNVTTSLSAENDTSIRDWALINTGVPISMTGFGGEELQNLYDDVSGRSGRNNFRITKSGFEKLYKHVISPKPETVTGWLKTISYYDLDHLFFSSYNASFPDVNFIPYTCTNEKCNYIFMSDNIDMMDMVKFDSDTDKELFIKILNRQETGEGLYASEIIPITNRYAVTFKEPTLYDMYIVPSLLNTTFSQKYSSIINYLPWLDSMYEINIKDKQLRPIHYKTFVGDEVKTIKSKVIAFAAIISKIKSDAYMDLIQVLAEFTKKKENRIKYVIPQTICPKCGHVIEAQESGAPNLLFTRHQLEGITSI